MANKRDYPLPLDASAPRQARILPKKGYDGGARYPGWVLWLRLEDASPANGEAGAAREAGICDVARDVHSIGGGVHFLCPLTAWDAWIGRPLGEGESDLMAWLPPASEQRDRGAAFPQWGVFYIAPAGPRGCTAKTAASHLREWAKEALNPWNGKDGAWGAPASLAAGRVLARPVRLVGCTDAKNPLAGCVSMIRLPGKGGGRNG